MAVEGAKFSRKAIVGFVAVQLIFITYGLTLTFWTLNEWYSDEKLNALFGGFMGSLFFLMIWRMLRRWAIRAYELGHFRSRA